MMLRRTLFATPLLAAGGMAQAQQSETCGEAVATDPFGLLGPEEDPEFGPILSEVPWAGQAPIGRRSPWSGQSVGTSAPRASDVAQAFRLLFDAPRARDPMVVARYFEALGRADAPRGSTKEPFNAEWKGLANPLIVSLFGTTHTRPALKDDLNQKGDQVSWCAAFVSFCLYASGRESAFTAMSGGYRGYGKSVDKAMPGDVVVFEQRGEGGRQGFGHVGFFVSETPTQVVVLGGNQGATGRGSVNTTTYVKEGRTLRLRDIRRSTKV